MRFGDQFLEAMGKKIALDRGGAADLFFVSHAHSDHTKALKNEVDGKVLATEETLAMVGRNLKRATTPDGITFLPSGHMLGSVQIRIEDGVVFTYTGDFKLEESLTAEKVEIKETDILVVEGTYGNPNFSFPSREELYDDIATWVLWNYEKGRIVLLGGYAVGKAQELIAIVNRYAGLIPVVTGKVASVSEIYNKFGVRLKFAEVGTPVAEELMNSNFVAIIPQHMCNLSFASKLSKVYGRGVRCAVATGWAKVVRYPVHASFPLSDHGDFKQILEYVEISSPERIYCVHGNEERLSSELRKRGYDASPMNGKGLQSTLTDY